MSAQSSSTKSRSSGARSERARRCRLTFVADGPALARALFELPGGVRTVEVGISSSGRTARLDGKGIRDPDELFGGLATVAFTPDDLSVVKEGPEGRRRLLDRAVQNRHPAHPADARAYLRALPSRNQLPTAGAGPGEAMVGRPSSGRSLAARVWRLSARSSGMARTRPAAAVAPPRNAEPAFGLGLTRHPARPRHCRHRLQVGHGVLAARQRVVTALSRQQRPCAAASTSTRGIRCAR